MHAQADRLGSLASQYEGREPNDSFLIRCKVVKVKKLIGRAYRLEVLLIFGSLPTVDIIKATISAPDWQTQRVTQKQVMLAMYAISSYIVCIEIFL